MKKINRKLLEEFLLLKIRMSDMIKETGLKLEELYNLEPEEKVFCKANHTIALAKGFIKKIIDSEWMHEWVDAITFYDWYEIYEYKNTEIEDLMVDIHLCLDDEGDEALGFCIEDIEMKVKELERLIANEEGI